MGTLTISCNGQVCVTVPLLAQADVSASRFLVAKAAVEEFLSRTIVKVGLVVLVLLVILLVLWAKVFRRNRRYGSRSGRRYRSSSYRGGRRGR